MFVSVTVEYKLCNEYNGNRRCHAEVKLYISCEEDYKIEKRFATGEMFYGENLHGTWGTRVKFDGTDYRTKIIANAYGDTWEEVDAKVDEEVGKVRAYLENASRKYDDLYLNRPFDRTYWLKM